jgi:hypothetical protein
LRWKNSIPASWEIFSVSARPIFVKPTEGTASGHPVRATPPLVGAPANPWLPDLFKKPARMACEAPLPLGEHAAGKAEISAQELTVVARFHGQAVLRCRVLA